MNKIEDLSDSDFVLLVNNSYSIKDILNKLNYTYNGNSWGYALIKNRMKKLNLSKNSFKPLEIKRGNKTVIDISNMFIENSKYSRISVRRNILKHKLLPYKCSICGISEWENKPIALELDHINGVNNDNRLSNLRFLCPNCHSQTVTYGSKNKEKNNKQLFIEEDIKDRIEEEYKRLKNIVKVANSLNLTINIVKTIVDERGLHKNSSSVLVKDPFNNTVKTFLDKRQAATWVIKNKLTKSNRIKTVIATINRNLNKLWKGYIFEEISD